MSYRQFVWFLEYHFRLTLQEYEKIGLAQDWLCAMCRMPETHIDPRSGKTRRLSVDHDQKCCPGRRSCGYCIRGLLCSTCNRALGQLKDDLEILERAADHIRSGRRRVGEIIARQASS